MNAANLLGFDYQAEAKKFLSLPGIIDVHSHIVGGDAARVYLRAARDYGITRTYSMTPWSQIEPVRQVLGDSVHFIAIPEWSDPDPIRAFGEGFLQTLEDFYQQGSRVVKFWSAPRGTDIGLRVGQPNLLKIDAPHRISAMKRAAELRMTIMVHVGDPDTWFATKYANAAVYGSKRDQYIGFERVLDMFDCNWIAAHMGGWPEDLAFLSGMLERHPNLNLDSSATKWIVRELSKHPREQIVEFFTRWRERVLFGSDIVTSNAHLVSQVSGNEKADQAGSEAEAYDLYASRYWALRMLLEGSYQGPSPIADPDLAMVEPGKYSVTDSPILVGQGLSPHILESMYFANAQRLLG